MASIHAGTLPEEAARAAGIDASTFYRWKARGKRDTHGKFREFREACIAAWRPFEETWKSPASFARPNVRLARRRDLNVDALRREALPEALRRAGVI